MSVIKLVIAAMQLSHFLKVFSKSVSATVPDLKVNYLVSSKTVIVVYCSLMLCSICTACIYTEQKAFDMWDC